MSAVRFVQTTPRLPVRNLARTLSFYCRILGFVAETLWPEEHPTFCILRRDTAQLGFYEPDLDHQPPGPYGAGELYLEVEGGATLCGTLRGQVAIAWGPEVYTYGRREFAIRDPDGYLIIFTEVTDDQPTCAVE